MAIDHSDASKYQCADYLSSDFVESGLWDEAAQLWLIEPLSRVEEHGQNGFLQVGRPGVDGIGLGYRLGHSGLWAYYPMEKRFQLLAPSLGEFLKGWAACTIRV